MEFGFGAEPAKTGLAANKYGTFAAARQSAADPPGDGPQAFRELGGIAGLGSVFHLVLQSKQRLQLPQ